MLSKHFVYLKEDIYIHEIIITNMIRDKILKALVRM